MTTTPQPDRITAAEIRELFKAVYFRLDQAEATKETQAEELRAEIEELRAEIEELRAEVHAMRGGLQQAATPPAQVGTFGEMEINSILKSIDKKNKINYTATGAPYSKWGVRVWDEVLPLLGIDPATLEFGNNTITPAIRARVLLGETTNKETGKTGIGPHKVTGKV
jgi:hypothetical protein